MVEKLVGLFISLFSGIQGIPFGKEIIVFIISLMPILELRGGLLAASLLGLNPIRSYIISVIGNIIPVPFILWFITSIIDFMRKRKRLSKVANWLDGKVEKHKEQIEKFGFLGTCFICRHSFAWNWGLDGVFNCSCFRNEPKKGLFSGYYRYFCC